ncbi:hypothetical protein RFI_18450 [Reticulomyxa filosa]|uniref:Uncharacterized protein n=1 Tax=Reticulomyxa filosa TaxID=46433 RepID=X6MZ78_RETFI|nr:hypothetical protein RFI_18450 [Reticulomyxa filosa]|eukprot:ETO18799.1 hypothetical protein RFI_18450 [Reticulomyxa filosa]
MFCSVDLQEDYQIITQHVLHDHEVVFVHQHLICRVYEYEIYILIHPNLECLKLTKYLYEKLRLTRGFVFKQSTIAHFEEYFFIVAVIFQSFDNYFPCNKQAMNLFGGKVVVAIMTFHIEFIQFNAETLSSSPKWTLPMYLITPAKSQQIVFLSCQKSVN